MKIYETTLHIKNHTFNKALIKKANQSEFYLSIVYVKPRRVLSLPYLLLRLDSNKPFCGAMVNDVVYTTMDDYMIKDFSRINRMCKKVINRSEIEQRTNMHKKLFILQKHMKDVVDIKKTYEDLIT